LLVCIYNSLPAKQQNIVTCGLIARESTDKHVSIYTDSWKPSRCETRGRVNEHSKDFPWIPLRYISGRSGKNQVSRKVTLNQVSHSRRQKPGDDNRIQTKREDSRSSDQNRQRSNQIITELKTYCELCKLTMIKSDCKRRC
jgi:hypothetical protein